MPRIPKVVTRLGDDGTTALGSGRRVHKDDLRVEAYGAVDELNAVLGLALAAGLTDALCGPLVRIQNELFHLGADLCAPEEAKLGRPLPGIEERHVAALDEWLAALNSELPPLENFVLPGGDLGAASLHVARTVCRRAERAAVRLAHAEPVGPQVVPYLNRLSDVLFLAARAQGRAGGRNEPVWNSRA